MNNFQRVFRNTSYLFISEIFLKALGFFWTVYLARSLSIELFGRYSLVNSIIAIFSFLPDLGVGLIVIREISRHREKSSEFLGNALFLNIALSILTVILVTGSSFLLQYDLELRYLIFIASMILFASSLRSVGIFYFDGTEKMKFSALLNAINSFFAIILGIVGFSLGFGLKGVFYGMLVGTLISFFVTWSMVKRYITPKLSLSYPIVKKLFTEGLPLGIASFAALVYMRIDSIMLAEFLGERSVGIYNSATPFVIALIQLLNLPFVVAVYPALSRLSNEDSGRFLQAIKKSLGVIALWSIPLAIIVYFFADLVPFIFGDKYKDAVPVLRVLIFFVPFASLSALLYKILIILNQQKIYLLVSLTGAVINVFLNAYLIPTMGIIGASVASVSTQIFLFIIYILLVLQFVKKR